MRPTEPRSARSRKCASARSGSGEAIASSRKATGMRAPIRSSVSTADLDVAESRGGDPSLQLLAVAHRVEQPRRGQVRLGGRLTQGGRDRLDRRPRRRDLGVKGGQVGEPQATREGIPRLIRRRQPVSLGAGRHLHPVLEPSPKAIGVEQGLRLAIAEQTGHHQAWQGARRVALAEIRPLAGVQELQRLHHHLDVADSARAELDVEAGRPRASPTRRPDRGRARAAPAPPRPSGVRRCAGR